MQVVTVLYLTFIFISDDVALIAQIRDSKLKGIVIFIITHSVAMEWTLRFKDPA